MRGRPKKDDALTPAQRSKKYRDAKSVTKNGRIDQVKSDAFSVTENGRVDQVNCDGTIVTVIDQLSLFALSHMRTRCDGNYTIEQLVAMSLRTQLVTWGYSFAQESDGEVCFGGKSFKVM